MNPGVTTSPRDPDRAFLHNDRHRHDAHSAIIGTTLAVLGAYFGRSLDRVAMFIVSCRFAIPLVSPIGSSLAVVMLALRHVSVGAFRGCFSPYLRSWT
jgi:hypothetical protein